MLVALFTRAWIEIAYVPDKFGVAAVALFTRAWIEISSVPLVYPSTAVALFTRAWIEIDFGDYSKPGKPSPSSRGRGLK